MTPSARALEIATEIFKFDVARHVAEAPERCGDGYEGECLKGACEILATVAALDEIARATREAAAKIADLAAEVLREATVKSSGPVERATTRGCAKIAEEIARSIREGVAC